MMRFVSYSNEELVNEECKRIFEEERAWAADAYGSFPDKALLIHSQEVTENLAHPYLEKFASASKIKSMPEAPADSKRVDRVCGGGYIGIEGRIIRWVFN